VEFPGQVSGVVESQLITREFKYLEQFVAVMVANTENSRQDVENKTSGNDLCPVFFQFQKLNISAITPGTTPRRIVIMAVAAITKVLDLSTGYASVVAAGLKYMAITTFK
jgi:hypothetical protein